MGSQIAASGAGFSKTRFLHREILPEVIGAPPENWLPSLKSGSSGLAGDDKREVRAAAVRSLRARKRLVSAVEESVSEVRQTEFGGRKVGDRLAGVLLFGSMTGRSYGLVSALRAIEPDRIHDIDFMPVVRHSDDDVVSWRALSDVVEDRLMERIAKKAGKPANTMGSIELLDGDPQATNAAILENARDKGLKHFDPLPWHFIGDVKAKQTMGAAIGLMGSGRRQ
jgi:hypothetical protein